MYPKHFYEVLLLAFISLMILLGITTQVNRAQEDGETYHEAPMLAERVAAGELPPVEERLPVTPLVVEPFDEIGTYGGELRYAGTFGDIVTFLGWEYLTRWETDMSAVYPNIVESYEVNADATVYTLRLRPGMRWSDGIPFTADDILFAINDIFLNPEIYALPPSNLLVAGEPVIAEKVDDYTVTLTFASSYGLFPELSAAWPGYQFAFFPKHWLAPYHMDYDPQNVEAIMTSLDNYPELANAGIQTWGQMFQVYALDTPWGFVGLPHQNDRPTLFPWITSELNPENGQLVLERNPYYWKVDTDGNQLPYIDRITLTQFAQNDDIKLLALLSGQFDTTKDPPQEDYSLFVESQETSGLKVYDVTSDGAGVLSISFNITYPDEQKASVYSNRDFRIGISHTINRQQIIALVYNGMGTPSQLAPQPDSPLYNEQLATQFIEYDIDLANTYLDRVLPNRDNEGYRLLPDGTRLVVNFQVQSDSFGLGFSQVAELVIQYLDSVGIASTLEIVPNILALFENNQIEASVFTGEGGSGISAILDPRWFVPSTRYSLYAVGWALWYENPSNTFAVLPPEHIRNQMALYNQAISTPDPETRIRLMQEVLQIAADEFYTVGVATPPTRYWLLSEDISNLPEMWFDGWIPGMQSAASPFQWFFDEDA